MKRFTLLALGFVFALTSLGLAQRPGNMTDTRGVAKRKETARTERYLAAHPELAPGAATPGRAVAGGQAQAEAEVGSRQKTVSTGNQGGAGHRWRRHSTAKKPIFGNR